MKNQLLKSRSGGVVKAKPLQLQKIVRVRIVRSGVIVPAWGVIGEGGKLYLVRKTLLGWRITDKNQYYIVKPEHFAIERVRKKYYVTVYVDDGDKISIPPPGNGAPAWRPDEVEMARNVVSTAWIVRMFAKEREKIYSLYSKLMWIMLLMFIGSLVLIGVIHWYSGNILANQIKEVIRELFPSPTGGGP